MKRIAASLAIVAATTSAHAFEFAGDMYGDMYLVGSVGRMTISQDTYSSAMSSASTTSSSGETTAVSSIQSNRDTSRTGYKLQLGFEFTPNFSIEGGYTDLGKTTDAGSYGTTVSGVSDWGLLGKLKYSFPGTGGTLTRIKAISGWNIAGVGVYPVNNKLSLFAKLGLIDAKVKYSSTATGPFATTFAANDKVESNWKGYYGVGAAFFPNGDRDLGVRFEYERYSKIGDINASGTTDINLMSLGVSSKF